MYLFYFLLPILHSEFFAAAGLSVCFHSRMHFHRVARNFRSYCFAVTIKVPKVNERLTQPVCRSEMDALKRHLKTINITQTELLNCKIAFLSFVQPCLLCFTLDLFSHCALYFQLHLSGFAPLRLGNRVDTLSGGAPPKQSRTH